MRCANKVSQWVPKGYSHKEIVLPCGSTGVHGQMLLCDECEATGYPNVPPWQEEDAGEADFEPYREGEY